MDKSHEHPDHERARNAGRVSPDHGDEEGDQSGRRRPTPGHPTVILDRKDITGAQIGPGGLGDLVPPEEDDREPGDGETDERDRDDLHD